MKKYLIFFLPLLLPISIKAQSTLIIGKVFDNENQPVWGASVCQKRTPNCTTTDADGYFQLILNNRYEKKLIVSFVGYENVEIGKLDTVRGVLNIIISQVAAEWDEDYPSTPHRDNRTTVESSLGVDLIIKNFDEFKPLLGNENIKIMNTYSGTFDLKLALTHKRYRYGFSFGFSDLSNEDPDSINIEFNTTQYAIDFGFTLLDSRRFIVTPNVAIKWNRYHLINSNKDHKIPINQYLTDRDLDIRFNQLTGFAGLNLEYKFNLHRRIRPDYWTFGLYGGYCFKLNDTPWVFSKRNRLNTDLKIGVKNFNFGFYFAFKINT